MLILHSFIKYFCFHFVFIFTVWYSFVLVYFVVCTIIICGHSVELYEAYKEDLQFDEEEEVALRKENV